MKKALLIAEKPDLMMKIRTVYNKHKSQIPYDIEFTCFVGHVCKLAPPTSYEGFDGPWDIDRLPIMPSWNNYKIEISEDKKDVVAKILKTYREFKPDLIINACDPDREGEHIFRLFQDTCLDKFKGEYKRFWCNDLTEESILKALINLQELKINLREAAFCRAKSDYLVGMNFTEAVTTRFMHGKRTIKIGRVKTPLLKICYDREIEIRNFKPSSKYQIKANYTPGTHGMLFDEQGINEYKTKDEAELVIKDINNKEHIVENITKKKQSENAPYLYKLSDIQIEAGKKYGYSAGKVLELVQSLYEAKYMSYPRTDLRYISQEAAQDIPRILKNAKESFPELKPYIEEALKQDIVSIAQKNKRLCNDAEVSKAGHTALILTTTKIETDKLSDEQINILKMVCIRLLSFFMKPLQEEKIEIIAKDNDYKFKITYKKLIDKGFTVLLDKKTEYIDIPDVKIGDKIGVKNIEAHEVKAVCPPRFTDADLVQVMENPAKYLDNQTTLNKEILKKTSGIGTQATRAKIISDLCDDGYCTKKKSGKTEVIEVTEFGMNVMKLLHNTSFAQVDLTAKWEQQLKDVENGRITSEQYKRIIEEYIKENIMAIKVLKGERISSARKLKNKCPHCGKDVLIGKKSYYCSNYNKDDGCKFILPFELPKIKVKFTEKDIETLIEGKPVEKTIQKEDKKWKQKIKYLNEKLEFIKEAPKEIGKCPRCGNSIVKFSWGYGCLGYKQGCKFGIKAKMAERTIKEKEVKELLEKGETSLIKDFISKNGKPFTAKLYIDEDKKINFKFK